MRKPLVGAAVFAVGGWAIASGALVIPTAFASSNNGTTFNGTTHCDPTAPPDPNNFACGQNPIFSGPPPSFVIIPPNCPPFLSSDNWVLNYVSGTSVAHFTQNKNGDWAGGTVEGPAVLTTSDGTVQYSGHATQWFGTGQNSNPGGTPTNQSMFGTTEHFQGSGPAGTLSIHVQGHATTNNAGTPTGGNGFPPDVTVTCS